MRTANSFLRYTMKKRKISLMPLCLLLSAVCLLSIGMVWKEYAEQAKDKNSFKELAEMVEPGETAEPDTDGEFSTETEREPTEQKRNLAPIMEQNRDCIGWLYIEGTAVDYPVMHTPSDPQKYLRRSFYGEYSQSGVPFLDYRCSLDSTNLIIYGHNMKNDTMFSDLKKYLDGSFLERHPIIELETADGVRYFTVTEVLQTNTSDAWYDHVDTDGSRRLILSTCYGAAKSGRLLIIAEGDNPR